MPRHINISSEQLNSFPPSLQTLREARDMLEKLDDDWASHPDFGSLGPERHRVLEERIARKSAVYFGKILVSKIAPLKRHFLVKGFESLEEIIASLPELDLPSWMRQCCLELLDKYRLSTLPEVEAKLKEIAGAGDRVSEDEGAQGSEQWGGSEPWGRGEMSSSSAAPEEHDEDLVGDAQVVGKAKAVAKAQGRKKDAREWTSAPPDLLQVLPEQNGTAIRDPRRSVRSRKWKDRQMDRSGKPDRSSTASENSPAAVRAGNKGQRGAKREQRTTTCAGGAPAGSCREQHHRSIAGAGLCSGAAV